MRYQHLFPYGEIQEETDEQLYSLFQTQTLVDMDDVIDVVKNYHIKLCELVSTVYGSLMEEFKKHGYLTGKDFAF